MKTILAFGDSNTWGLVPGSKPLERYDRSIRWTGLLEGLLDDTRVIEAGLCGRTTVFEDPLRPGRKGVSALPSVLDSQSPLDLVLIMLGTNDCKTVYHASPYTIGKGLELCLDEILKFVPPERILIISPIFLGDEVMLPHKDPEFGERSVEVSHGLKDVYSKTASERGTAFLAASDHAKADTADDEHLNPEGHRALANALEEKIRDIFERQH